jgi:nitrate/nitrite-specific signal transduction histidine kinase
LEVSVEEIFLEIADNGLGFDPSLGGGGGFGLASMRQRAERLGGSLRIDSTPGAGTRVCVQAPRSAQQPGVLGSHIGDGRLMRRASSGREST